MHRLRRQVVHALRMEPHMLHLPHHRPFFAVLHAEALPLLIAQFPTISQMVTTAQRRATAADQTGRFPGTPLARTAAARDARRVNPTRERHRHFGYELLLSAAQSLQK